MPAATTAPSKADALRDDRHVVARTTAALLVCLWVGVPWVGSLAAALPLALYLHSRPGRVRPSLLWRWVAAVFFTGLAMTALGADRAARAIASGHWAVASTRAWLDGTGPAFPPLAPLAGAVVLLAAAPAAWRGLPGILVLAEVLLCASASAASVYGRAVNAFTASAVATAPWTLAALAGGALLVSPARSWTQLRAGDAGLRRAAAAGLACLALSLVLRALAAGAFTRLVRQLTVS